VKVKAFMYREPTPGTRCSRRFAECFARYVREQVDAGADVIQLFDSWVGVLSPADYAEFVRPAQRAHPRRGRRADDPLRHRNDGAAASDGR
jgi:uroporphyrinogen decarboxylase